MTDENGASSRPLREKHRGGDGDRITITLSLDRSLVNQLREDAKDTEQNLDTRINAVLRKHVNYYRMTELTGAVILPPALNQFFIDKMDETEFTQELEKFYSLFVTSLYTQRNIPLTLDNLVKFSFQELLVYGGGIKNFSRFVDKQDGKICLLFRHEYDLKWSRILAAGYSLAIEHFLHYMTVCRYFSNGLEIKILEQNPI